MIRLKGLKAQIEYVNYNESRIRETHVLFNINTYEFLALMIRDGRCNDKMGYNNGWRDITEICNHYNRKPNYANLRTYAIALIEERNEVVEVANKLAMDYVEQYPIIEGIEQASVDDVSEFITIGELTGEDDAYCYECVKSGKWYDSENEYMVEFEVVVINKEHYRDYVIEIKNEYYLSKDELPEAGCINSLYGQIITACESSGYAYFGIRYEYKQYDVGEITENSHSLYQDAMYGIDYDQIYPYITTGPYAGFYLGDELSGTCALHFTDFTSLDAAYSIIHKYSGAYLTVIGSDSLEYGEDAGEVILKDAEVLMQIPAKGGDLHVPANN